MASPDNGHICILHYGTRLTQQTLPCTWSSGTASRPRCFALPEIQPRHCTSANGAGAADVKEVRPRCTSIVGRQTKPVREAHAGIVRRDMPAARPQRAHNQLKLGIEGVDHS